MPSVRFSMMRYLRTNAAMPRCWSCFASALASRSIASATNAPPGARMMPVPVALPRSGRYAVTVGVTTLKMTVPTGVFAMVSSFWVQRSEPGATPSHTFTVWAFAGPSAMTIPAVVSHSEHRIFVPLRVTQVVQESVHLSRRAQHVHALVSLELIEAPQNRAAPARRIRPDPFQEFPSQTFRTSLRQLGAILTAVLQLASQD